MMVPNKSLPALRAGQQLPHNYRTFMQRDFCDNEFVNTGQGRDSPMRGVETDRVAVAGTGKSKPQQITTDVLIAWENMAGVANGIGILEGEGVTDDADLGEVDLSDLLELEKEQPDDFILYNSNGIPQWAASQEREIQPSFGTCPKKQYPAPSPIPPTPPYPILGMPIPGLDIYNQIKASQSADKNSNVSELPVGDPASISPSLFFEQFEEVEEAEDDLPENEFVKTEVCLTNAEWWLRNILPFGRFRCKQPSRLRTCYTVVDLREGVGLDVPADSLDGW